MDLRSETLLTVQYPQSDMPDLEMTWAEFMLENDSDDALIADVHNQIAVNNYAVIGGGASPLVWVFA